MDIVIHGMFFSSKKPETGQNFILQLNDLLTQGECHAIRDWFLNTKHIEKAIDRVGYHFADHDLNEPLPDSVAPMMHAINTMWQTYATTHAEIEHLPGTLELSTIRFKWWKPGDAFSNWHSEHSYLFPTRVLSFMIYLSDNDCATEFFRGEKYETKTGRGIMFPAYFTHTHRGAVSADGKDRYALSGYFVFKQPQKGSEQ